LTTQVVSTHEVTAEIFIESSPPQLYYFFSTLSGWLDWFAQKGIGNVSKQGILQMHLNTAGRLAFYFREFEHEKRVALSIMSPNTPQMGDVELLLEETEGGTTIRIEHSGMEPEDVDWLQNLWQDSLNNLKELTEEGRDPRLWNRPFLGITVADWVTPEYAAKHQLATESGMHLNSVFEGRGAAEAGISGGDTILSLAGIAITDYEALLSVYKEHRAGDTIDVEYYHGKELRQARLTLSAFPVPDVPPTAQDIADKLDHFFQKANKKIEQLFSGKNEAQAEYRPAAGEWNAKEVLAHMIASEGDAIHWLGSYLGIPIYLYNSGPPEIADGALPYSQCVTEQAPGYPERVGDPDQRNAGGSGQPQSQHGPAGLRLLTGYQHALQGASVSTRRCPRTRIGCPGSLGSHFKKIFSQSNRFAATTGIDYNTSGITPLSPN